jgi:hypothetical protein
MCKKVFLAVCIVLAVGPADSVSALDQPLKGDIGGDRKKIISVT